MFSAILLTIFGILGGQSAEPVTKPEMIIVTNENKDTDCPRSRMLRLCFRSTPEEQTEYILSFYQTPPTDAQRVSINASLMRYATWRHEINELIDIKWYDESAVTSDVPLPSYKFFKSDQLHQLGECPQAYKYGTNIVWCCADDLMRHMLYLVQLRNLYRTYHEWGTAPYLTNHQLRFVYQITDAEGGLWSGICTTFIYGPPLDVDIFPMTDFKPTINRRDTWSTVTVEDDGHSREMSKSDNQFWLGDDKNATNVIRMLEHMDMGTGLLTDVIQRQYERLNPGHELFQEPMP